jgi:uncharacterized RDD family membrane protein YckC
MSANYDPNAQQTGGQWAPPPFGNPAQQMQPGGAPPMNYALWADRVLAALIDAGVAFVVMIVLYILVFVITLAGAGILGGVSQDAGGLFGCTGCLLFFILPPISYFAAGLFNKVYWVSRTGHSIGHGLMKLAVVDAQGGTIPMGTSVMRLLSTVGLAFVPIIGSALDLLWPLWDPQRQALHDKAVGTFVIKTE